MFSGQFPSWEGSGVGRFTGSGFSSSVFVLLGLVITSPLSAQPPPARPSPGRYLFIVDTSSAMRSQATAVRETAENLLQSGMHAQLNRGDSIGVWTYNNRLHAGNLPVQQWSPEREQAVASNIVAFLKSQKYEKQSRFDAVRPELQRLVKESERLTTLLITDGSAPISGTPFDSKINEFLRKNSGQQKQKRMPFTIVLRSFRGKFASFTMNPAPWPVQFPAFPPEPKVAAKKQPKPPPKKATTPPTAAPLIVVGEKREPVSSSPTAPSEPTSTKPAPAGVAPGPVEPASLSVESATPKAGTQSETTAPASTVAMSQPKSDTPSVAVTPAPPVSAALAPIEPSAQMDEPKPEPASGEPPSTQVATATQPERGFNLAFVLVVCAVATVLVGALFFLLRRRAQAVPSLITRSMDQEKE